MGTVGGPLGKSKGRVQWGVYSVSPKGPYSGGGPLSESKGRVQWGGPLGGCKGRVQWGGGSIRRVQKDRGGPLKVSP